MRRSRLLLIDFRRASLGKNKSRLAARSSNRVFTLTGHILTGAQKMSDTKVTDHVRHLQSTHTGHAILTMPRAMLCYCRSNNISKRLSREQHNIFRQTSIFCDSEWVSEWVSSFFNMPSRKKLQCKLKAWQNISLFVVDDISRKSKQTFYIHDVFSSASMLFHSLLVGLNGIFHFFWLHTFWIKFCFWKTL